jgi:hypothetical protein
MTNSPEPAQAPLLLAELCCYDLPRDMWARALLRARQAGAEALRIIVQPGAYTQIGVAAPPNGASDFAHQLAVFVQECAQLGVQVLLDLRSQASAALPHNAPPGSHGASHAADRAAVPRWLEECSAALVGLQSPDGPIIALRLGPEQAGLEAWLRDQGWAIPIQFGAPPELQHQAHQQAAAALSQIAHVDRLIGGGVPAPRPAGHRTLPLLRRDGSARPAFWKVKAPRMLLGATMPDYTAARAPADLALIGDSDLDGLARQLAAAGIDFDWYAPGAADPGKLARHALVLRVDEALAAISGAGGPDGVSELIEARGGHARYAWADAPEIEVGVRYGTSLIYLFIHNRRASAYNGMLTYRAPGGDVLHLHIGIGAGRTGIVTLRDDEVVGAAIDGDGAEGGWLARGLTSSMVFNAAAGGVAACGGALLLTAPQSGRFQLRRGDGWEGMQAYRLLLNGQLLPARLQIEATHLLLPYTAEDERGQTDLYLLLPAGRALPAELRDYLAVTLRARAAELRYAAELAQQATADIAPLLDQAARALIAGAQHLATIDDYAAAWQAAEQPLEACLAALERPAHPPSAAATPLIDRIADLVMGET